MVENYSYFKLLCISWNNYSYLKWEQENANINIYLEKEEKEISFKHKMNRLYLENI